MYNLISILCIYVVTKIQEAIECINLFWSDNTSLPINKHGFANIPFASLYKTHKCLQCAFNKSTHSFLYSTIIKDHLMYVWEWWWATFMPRQPLIRFGQITTQSVHILTITRSCWHEIKHLYSRVFLNITVNKTKLLHLKLVGDGFPLTRNIWFLLGLYKFVLWFLSAVFVQGICDHVSYHCLNV